jgi:hypothetical protein
MAQLNTVSRQLNTQLGMHRILFLPDIRAAGYPANPAEYLDSQLCFWSNMK